MNRAEYKHRRHLARTARNRMREGLIYTAKSWQDMDQKSKAAWPMILDTYGVPLPFDSDIGQLLHWQQKRRDSHYPVATKNLKRLVNELPWGYEI